MIWIIRNIKNKFFKNKMRSKTCRSKSHTINLNEIEYLQVKLSSTMNNVKKPIKLHKKNSLDKYSENIIYLLISYKICYYIDLN
jgi:hypothetical protein